MEAIVYSVLYALVVAGDHGTTLIVTAAGGSETNPWLRSSLGQLAEGRAILLMLALWPIMLALIALGRRRATASAYRPNPILRQLIGSTAAGALLLPVGFVFVKAIAAATNAALILTGVSAIDVARTLLRPIGLAQPPYDYFLVAIVFLAAATALARPVTVLWARRMAGAEAAGPALS